MPYDHFTPLDDISNFCNLTKSVESSQSEKWLAVLPAVTEAKSTQMRHPKLGKPSAVYCYRDLGGRVLGYICRFDPGEDRKIFLPLTCWRHKRTGLIRWLWKGFETPRPLYGLDRLAARPDAPVYAPD